MEKIQGYRTSDGLVWADEEIAARHEKQFDLQVAVDMACRKFCRTPPPGATTIDVTDWHQTFDRVTLGRFLRENIPLLKLFVSHCSEESKDGN